MWVKSIYKSHIKLLSFVATLLVILFQGILLFYVYKSLEAVVFTDVNDAFKSSSEQELLARAAKVHAPDGTIIPTPKGALAGSVSDMYIGFNDHCNKYGHPRNLDTLRKYFDKYLAVKNIHHLEYKIITLKPDTNYYNSPYKFYNDTRYNDVSFRGFKTHIIPVLSDLTMGIQAVVINPYKMILSKMFLLLLISLLVLMFVIYSVGEQIKVINEERALALFRKDHTYSMIHDMSTPMNVIRMSCGEISKIDAVAGNKEAGEFVQMLNEGNERLIDMRKKILDVYKLENKNSALSYSKIDINDFFDALIKKFTSYTTKQINFEKECGAGLFLNSDIQYLTDIFDNLIENSIKYSGTAVNIKLSAVENNKNILLKVRDNGYGIPNDEIEKMLDKFERGINSKTSEGYGLGLNFVYQVVSLMKGVLGIESKVNEFTEVSLKLPVNN